MTTTEPEHEVAANTAAEEDHENIETFVGEDADAPVDTGRPVDES